MCGIAGELSRSAGLEAVTRVRRIVNAQLHRGPDEQHVLSLGPMVLGQDRLKIIDLSPNGSQPMQNEDGTVWIVFNGEIYNFAELRAELIKKGHKFRSNADTEVVIHMYEEEGARCVARLRGMFAFGLWDVRRGQLLLARDRLGKKPLIYTRQPHGFMFASEIGPLVQSLPVTPPPDMQAIDYFLALGYIPDPLTAFKGVYKLPPATFMLLDQDGNEMMSDRYWRVDLGQPVWGGSEQDLQDQVIEQLRESTRIRTFSDVPLGAFLSGGVDSSAIVAMLAQHVSKVKTFTVSFGESDYDESRFARMVAQRYDTDHTELRVRADPRDIPEILAQYGEPFADPSAIPSYYVAREASQHVTVVLNGDGGDESFGGYKRYLGFLKAKSIRLPSHLRYMLGRAAHFLPASSRTGAFGRVRTVLQLLSSGDEARYETFMNYFSGEERRELWNAEPGMVDLAATDQYLRRYLAAGSTLPGVHQLLHCDLHTYLPGDLLTKMDIATTTWSLEGRSPFLDHRFVEFAARIPAHLKIRGMTGKYLLKKALEPYLPHEVMYRPKMGFDIPLDHWLRTDLRQFVQGSLYDGGLDAYGLNADYVRRLVEQHNSGARPNGRKIFALLSLVNWHRRFIATQNSSERAV